MINQNTPAQKITNTVRTLEDIVSALFVQVEMPLTMALKVTSRKAKFQMPTWTFFIENELFAQQQMQQGPGPQHYPQGRFGNYNPNLCNVNIVAGETKDFAVIYNGCSRFNGTVAIEEYYAAEVAEAAKKIHDILNLDFVREEFSKKQRDFSYPKPGETYQPSQTFNPAFQSQGNHFGGQVPDYGTAPSKFGTQVVAVQQPSIRDFGIGPKDEEQKVDIVTANTVVAQTAPAAGEPVNIIGKFATEAMGSTAKPAAIVKAVTVKKVARVKKP